MLNLQEMNKSILIEQAEEDEITHQHDSVDDDDITPTLSGEESEEEISILDRDEILSLIETEIANFKQNLDESEQKKSEKRMKEIIDAVMLKVEIKMQMNADQIVNTISQKLQNVENNVTQV